MTSQSTALPVSSKSSSPAVESVVWQGTVYKTLLTSDGTGASVGMVESVDQPGFGPPRHVHHQEDETFYVIEGEVEFWMAGESSSLGSGGALFIPRGVEHTFRVTGQSPARMLIIMTPGGFEGFFAAMAEHQYRIPEDMEQITAVAERFHLSFTGPPLGAE